MDFHANAESHKQILHGIGLSSFNIILTGSARHFRASIIRCHLQAVPE